MKVVTKISDCSTYDILAEVILQPGEVHNDIVIK